MASLAKSLRTLSSYRGRNVMYLSGTPGERPRVPASPLLASAGPTVSFLVGAWVRLRSKPLTGTHVIMQRGNALDIPNYDWNLQYEADDRFNFRAYHVNRTTGVGNLYGTKPTFNPTVGKWHLLLCYHSAASGQLGIWIDKQPPTSVLNLRATQDINSGRVAPLGWGRSGDADITLPSATLDIGPCFMYKGADYDYYGMQDAIYNNGVPCRFRDLPAQYQNTANINWSAWWDMDETTGTRYDQISGLHALETFGIPVKSTNL